MIVLADYPFLDVMWTMLVFFLWVAWFWMLFGVWGDIFRRHDLSGLGKTGWFIFTLVLPFLGVFVYLVSHEPAQHRAGPGATSADGRLRALGRRQRRRRGGDREGQATPGQRRDHPVGVRRAQAESTGLRGILGAGVRDEVILQRPRGGVNGSSPLEGFLAQLGARSSGGRAGSEARPPVIPHRAPA
jgi:hypothetical protein